MEEKIKRPAVIWISQIGLLLLALTVLVNAGYIAFALRDDLLSIGVIIVILLMLVFASVPLIAFRGLAKQRRYGRNLALLFFASIWLLWLGRLYSGIVLTAFENIDVNDKQHMMAVIISYVILLCLLLGLIVMLAFSKTVTAWLPPEK